MKKFVGFLVLLFVIVSLGELSLYSDDAYIKNILSKKLNENSGEKRKKRKKKNNVKTIDFRFKDTELVDVINILAAEKNVNVIFPIGNDAIKSKLTIGFAERLTIDEAWDFLYAILDIAGYSMFPKGNMYSIVKTGPTTPSEPLRIFIPTHYDEIPSTDERITCLFYFSNIDVSKQEGQNVIKPILTGLISKDGAKIEFASAANGVLIIDKANNVKSIVQILSELDKAGFKEQLDIIKLNHSSADVVAKLFSTNILQQQEQQRRYGVGARKKSEAMYFDKETRVIPVDRVNSLILIGREQAIERIKDFIFQYIDVPIEGGRSILHRKKLQYLDAPEFKTVLEQVVKSQVGGDVQARAGRAQGGPQRFFSEVKIESDKPKAKEGEDKEKGKYEYSGTNSLIIAAKNEDWEVIEDLIGKLDTPQPQVIIEVLIIDLQMDDTRKLGSALRNPDGTPLLQFSKDGQGVNFQSAQFGQIVTEQTCCNTVGENTCCRKTIAADLLKATVGESSGGEEPVTTYVNPFVKSAQNDPGSALISLGDKCGSTWSILKLLSGYNNFKILSHPYVVAMSNIEATVGVGEDRLLPGQAEGTSGGSSTQSFENLPAKVTVKIKPKIASENIVNLQVFIEIDQFKVASGPITLESPGDRQRRKIRTNANVASSDILALGGLIKEDIKESTTQTPILGRIPILGWFFKSKSSIKVKNNLTVFIRPTIVYPRYRKGVSDYTKDYISVVKDHVQEGMLFDTLRDPVTRWFFKVDVDAADAMDAFSEQYKTDRIEQERGRTILEIIESDEILDKNIAKKREKLEELDFSEDKIEEINSDIQKQNLLGKRLLQQLDGILHENDVSPTKEEHTSSTKEENASVDELMDLVKDEENPLLETSKSIK